MAEYDDFQDGDSRDLDINELRGMSVTELATVERDLELTSFGGFREKVLVVRRQGYCRATRRGIKKGRFRRSGRWESGLKNITNGNSSSRLRR